MSTRFELDAMLSAHLLSCSHTGEPLSETLRRAIALLLVVSEGIDDGKQLFLIDAATRVEIIP